MPYTAEIFGATIVLVGSFNPAILTPEWLERNHLIGKDDANVARGSPNLLTSRQVAVVETEWFTLQVLENQFTLTSKGALLPTLRDLAVGICLLVPHTPITALGMNFLAHFKMPTVEAQHKIGDTLAPKILWNQLLDLEHESVGLVDLTMRVQPFKRDKPTESKDSLNIQLQPSGRIQFGIFMSYNDHREMFAHEENGIGAKAETAAGIFANYWEDSWARAVSMFDNLLDKSFAA